MKDDTISRQAAIDAAMNDSLIINAMDSVKDGDIHRTKRAIVRLLASLPSIDAVKHGRWIEENTRTRSSKFYCSVCHRTAYDPQPTRIAGWVKRCRYAYCPNCGAKMDETVDE